MSHHRPNDEYSYSRVGSSSGRPGLRPQYSGRNMSTMDLYRVTSRDEGDDMREKRSSSGYYRTESSRSLYRPSGRPPVPVDHQDRPYPPPSWSPHRRMGEFSSHPSGGSNCYRRQLGPTEYDFPAPPVVEDNGYRTSTSEAALFERNQAFERKQAQLAAKHGIPPRKDIHLDPSFSTRGGGSPSPKFLPPEYRYGGRTPPSWSKQPDSISREEEDYQLAMKEKEALRRERAAESHFPLPYDPDFPSVQESEVSSSGDSLGLTDDGMMYHLSRFHRNSRSATSSTTGSPWSEEDGSSDAPYTYGGQQQQQQQRVVIQDAPHEVLFAADDKNDYRRELSPDRSVHRYGAPPARRNDAAPTVEVAPGEFMRLRGADETWRAIRNDFYIPCECICCNITIFCIQDAKLVLCPECRVVSPIENGTEDGGVGLGFSMEELAKWQSELVQKFTK